MGKKNGMTRGERRRAARERAQANPPQWMIFGERQKQKAQARKTVRKHGASGKAGTGYGSRNAYLKNLGFANYAAYLKSDLWKQVKERAFTEKGRQCLTCGAPATVLHHLRYHYDDLRGDTLDNIVPVCNPCHREFEFLVGVKVSVQMAADAYRKKREAYLASIKVD